MAFFQGSKTDSGISNYYEGERYANPIGREESCKTVDSESLYTFCIIQCHEYYKTAYHKKQVNARCSGIERPMKGRVIQRIMKGKNIQRSKAPQGIQFPKAI